MSQKKLKEAIDKMVEDSIRRILPQVMNEILVKTIANASVIRESNAAPVQHRRQQSVAQKKMVQRRPSSLSHLLDPEAGADFYNDPRTAMAEAMNIEDQPQSTQPLAQRIQNLPPELRGLAEGMDLDDDGGEMWDDGLGDSAVIPSVQGPPLERAAQTVGLDFSRMREAIKVTEKKAPDSSDRAAQAQFDALRIKRMREQLNGGKPVE